MTFFLEWKPNSGTSCGKGQLVAKINCGDHTGQTNAGLPRTAVPALESGKGQADSCSGGGDRPRTELQRPLNTGVMWGEAEQLSTVVI